MSYSESIDPTIPVRKGLEIDLPALQRYVNTNAPQIGQIQEVRQFPGGFSNITYLLQSDAGEFVLRRPPLGANIQSAHDMGREYHILKTIQPYYQKIPETICYSEDVDVIGSPFFIMSSVRGMILRGTLVPKTELPFSDIARSLIQNLAALHDLPLSDADIKKLGKPEQYIQRQVAGWTKRYRKAATDRIPEMDELATWLIDHQPDSTQVSLIHNDYKYDNLVLDPEQPTEILAVLDWEMATVGHPLMDLGTTLAYWAEPTDTKLLFAYNLSWMPGNPSRKELIDWYFESTNRPAENMLFYYVFGLFKVGVIAQQIYARYKAGKATDPRFEALIKIVKVCGNKGKKAITTGKI